MDRILKALQEINFKYADRDPQAVAALTSRIVQAARAEHLITYKDLVKGVQFQIPGVKSGVQFEIDEFAPFEQSLIADFLGYINLQAYRQARVLPSAIVVRKEDNRPSPVFFTFFKPLVDMDPEAFWIDEVRKVQEHYQK